MGKKIRITRKTLKEDEIRTTWMGIEAWIERHARTLLTVLAAVVVAFVLFRAYSCSQANKLAQASLAISNAQRNIQFGLFSANEQAREQRLAAAEAELQVLEERGGKLAPYAKFLLGNVAFFRNNFDAAADYYQQYLNMVKDPVKKADAFIALGYSYENKFFWTGQTEKDREWLDRAIECFQSAENLTSGTMQQYMAMLGRARLLDLMGTRDAEARALYERIERERKLAPETRPPSARRSQAEWAIDETERAIHLFTLAETARLRRERLAAQE